MSSDSDRIGYTKGMKYKNTFLAKIERNQIPLSRSLLFALYFSHFISPRGISSKFLCLQYKVGTNASGEAVYEIGADDAYYVIRWVILLTFLRSSLMRWCFEPFVSYFCSSKDQKTKTRFAEQSWSFVYFTCSFIVGFYLYFHSPYWLNIDNLYSDWPHYQLTSLFKRYYLVSIAVWIQQVFVLNIEARRKDHYQMFAHHIITCILIIGSYYYYYIRIGHLILMIMDSGDIALSAAKMLKYMDFHIACDFMFFIFLSSYVFLRICLYDYLLYHAWSKASELMRDAKCVPGVPQKRCWTPTVINAFLVLLGGLQVITIIWLYLIVKVAYRVLSGAGAEDVRSDSEDASDTEEDSKPTETPVVEVSDKN
ncbi:Piso0_001399 [Millerozyma farinosa CBS 7064]|uniref:Piso0_001399 protein n=1 Tax=Pichia sorbitophila (strain ATCC MYA-4447 / BCRC 22081 / CBS 7064 / NBRC 10061 / NRRL Y-12695) TaxID=559304 RepID=G8YN24_PICSO|nr:Piso0_001399 [Millerozyma farinosa CBS 7064]